MRYSFIIPVYNRPDEVDELLESLTRQTDKDFEVIVVEDGSSVPCKEVVKHYADCLDIHYYNKPNSGPGQPVIMVPNAVMGNILLFWIPIVFCPKVIWRRSEQNCKGRGRMLSGAPTVRMSRFPMCKKPSTMP